MQITYTAAAIKGLRTMPKADAAMLRSKLASIAADPFGSHPYAKRLVGEVGFRCRQGDWRALYVVDAQAALLTVFEVKHRREVYR